VITRKEKQSTDAGLTPAQQLLNALWDQHVRNEFITKDAGAALETMVLDAYVHHVPVMTGGVGRDQLKEFYAKHFIPNMPFDTEIVPIARTIGSDRLVDEMIIRFAHSIDIDWMLPGIAPTGKRVEWPCRREHAITPHSLYYIVVEIVTVSSCTKGKFPPSEGV
jgi:carboxymethylenebutenolidase